MRKLRDASAALLTLALLAGGQAARAETLADRVPADAIGYVGWAGTDALGPAYQGSNLKVMLDALKLEEFIQGKIDAEMARNEDAQKRQDVKLLRDVAAAVTQSPSALYVGPMAAQGNGREFPEFALLSRVGADRARDLAGRAGALIERTKRPEMPAVGVSANGELLVMHIGAGVEEKLKGVTAAQSLASRDGFKKAMAQVNGGKEPAVAMYADGATILSMIAGGIERSGNAQVLQYWPAIREGLGVNALGSAAWAGNFDGKNWQTSIFVGMSERRVGMMAFLDNPPLTDTALRFIPATATSAAVFQFNGPRLLADIQRTAALVSPDAPRQVDRVFAQIFAISGVDFKLDLLPSLGQEFIMYGSPDAAGNSIRGLALVNKLKDVDRAQQAIIAMENIINLTVAQRAPDAKVQFRTETLAAPFEGVTAHVIATEQVSPAWAIHEGVFYFAMSLPTLQSAVERGGGAAGPSEKGSLVENAQFAALRRKLGQEKISAFSFADLAKSAPETYQLVNRAVERAARENPELNYKLPPLDKLMPAMGPVLQVSWTDGDGFHLRDTGPFPLAVQLSPMQLLLLHVTESMQPQRGPGLP